LLAELPAAGPTIVRATPPATKEANDGPEVCPSWADRGRRLAERQVMADILKPLEWFEQSTALGFA
jgi:hypothetical protein